MLVVLKDFSGLDQVKWMLVIRLLSWQISIRNRSTASAKGVFCCLLNQVNNHKSVSFRWHSINMLKRKDCKVVSKLKCLVT